NCVCKMFSFTPDVTIHGLTREQVRQCVYLMCREYFGGSMHGLVEFHRVYSHKGVSGTNVEHLIGWEHPMAIEKLKHEAVTLFVDDVLAMNCHNGAPLSLGLLPFGTIRTMKLDGVSHVLEYHKLAPSTVICDFEAGLIKVVLTQFPEARALGRQMKNMCYLPLNR
ncbi:hypothetical protein GN958_ATG16083, partial [Phytophthora infestans]